MFGISLGKQNSCVFSLQSETDGRFEPIVSVGLEGLQFAPEFRLPVHQNVFLGSVFRLADLLREAQVKENVDLLLSGSDS